MDKSKKWPVSSELREWFGMPSEVSYDGIVAMGFSEGGEATVLVDRTDSGIVFLYRGVWRGLGTNGL